MQTLNYNVADTIRYRAFGNDLRTVTVTAKHADIKNGRAGFDGTLQGIEGPANVWGYDSQITEVVKPSPWKRCERCKGFHNSQGHCG